MSAAALAQPEPGPAEPDPAPPAAPEPIDLPLVAAMLRGRVVDMAAASKSAHLGGCLSCIDILAAAYWGPLAIDPRRPSDPDRDRFILSKGHAAMALYAALAARGFFPEEELASYARDGSRLAEHPPARGLPGVEAATGSLGHGLPIGVGMALAGRLAERSYRVVALLSDGECEEGSTWEAALLAAAQKLERLCVVVDRNGWQATGRPDEVMALHPLKEKWAAFGWSAREVDGHDPDQIAEHLGRVPDGSGRPVALIARTVKGKGVSFMEDDNNWHYRAPTWEEAARAHRELGLA